LCRYIGTTAEAELLHGSKTAETGNTTYSDASYASERGRTSVTGYATRYGEHLINWGSQKQSVVAQSTCEPN